MNNKKTASRQRVSTLLLGHKEQNHHLCFDVSDSVFRNLSLLYHASRKLPGDQRNEDLH